MSGQGRETAPDKKEEKPVLDKPSSSSSDTKTDTTVHPKDDAAGAAIKTSVAETQTNEEVHDKFGDVFDELDKGKDAKKEETKKDAEANKDADVKKDIAEAKIEPVKDKAELIKFNDLPKDEQAKTIDLITLQGQITKLSKEFIPDPKEREQFLKRLGKEVAVRGDTEEFTLEKKPEFGDATRDGFQKMVQYLENSGIKRRFMELNGLQLTDVPGLNLKWAEKDIGVPGIREGNLQKLEQGKGYLDIDPRNVRDVSKVSDVLSWMDDVDKKVHDEKIERRSELLGQMLERGIKDGRFPAGWRRTPEMDKETWCAAVEQTMGTYMRATEIIEAINHVKRADAGYKTDAIEKLPPGVTVKYDANSRATNVSFGDYMMQDLMQQSDVNKPKLADLAKWCDQYELEAKKAIGEWMQSNNAMHNAAGYGEAEIQRGWINPETNKFVVNSDSPGEGWKSFNLMSFDMSIDKEYDKFGKVSKYIVTPDVRFQYVPPVVGYLNLIKADVHNPHAEKGEPKEYSPEDYVCVMTGPGQAEMIKAKNLEDWRSMQELKLVGGKAIIFTMDAAMVASGGISLATKSVIKAGAKEAIEIGARELSTKAVASVPADLITRQSIKGAVEIGLGLGGPLTHGAGSKDIPLLKTAGELRSYYFLAHGGYSMLEMLKAPEAIGALARAVNPRMAAGAEGLVNSIRGSEATREAMHLAQTGALAKMGEGWQTAEQVTRQAFAVSEAAFIGQFAWDTTSMYHEYQKNHRPWAFTQAEQSILKAAIHDTKDYQKLIDNRVKKEDVLEIHMRDYKQSLGPLDEKQGATIDGIIDKVKKLSAENVPAEQRQKYVQELMQHFRYSGEKMTDMRKASHAELVKSVAADTERESNPMFMLNKHEPYSEAQYLQMAQSDATTFDPRVQKMAALATMILSRNPDGTWPDTLTQREVTLPGYKLEVPVPPKRMQEWESRNEGRGGNDADRPKPDIIEVPEMKLAQNLPLKEVYDMLSMDLHHDSNLQSRVTKASALQEVGMISSEHYGSLLIKQLAGNDGSKGEQIRTLVELGRTINRLGIEESVRNSSFDDNQRYIARGMTAGLTSADLKRNLEAMVPGLKDPDVKATAQFTLDFLNKKQPDEVDRRRFNEVFFKENAGITPDAYRKQLLEDMNAKPDTPSGWERKMNAIKHFMDDALTAGDTTLAMDAYKAARTCALEAPSAAIKVEGVKLLLDKTAGGTTRIDSLEALLKSKNLPVGDATTARFLSSAFNLFADGVQDKEGGLNDREDRARARADLIDLMVPLAAEKGGAMLKGALEGQLKSLIDYGKTADPYREVRLAAVKGLIDLNSGNNQENLKLIAKALDPKIEQSAAVRLQAVKAVEALVPNSKERKKILSEFADKEPDIAVASKLRRYFEPKGSVLDATSQVSRKEVTDKVVEQNKPEIRTDDVEKWLKTNFNQLVNHDNIFSYFDPNTHPFKAYEFGGDEYTTTFAKHWEVLKEMATRTWQWAPGSIESTNSLGREGLVRMEGQSQVVAYMNYQSQVNQLYNQATAGGTSKDIAMGTQKVSAQQAAIFALGNLLKEGSRMGDPFYKHRQKYEMDIADPTYKDFTDNQQKVRMEGVTERNYWTRKYQTDYDKNGVAPSKGDPWMKMEVEIANKLKTLASTSPDNLPIIKDQLMAGLKSDKIMNDDSRVTMIEGLDVLVSRPNVDPETKQDAVRQIARIVQTMPEAYNNKSKAMIAMLGFLDKHGLEAFEKYSPDYAEVRKALSSTLGS